jgi:hypothetical protein
LLVLVLVQIVPVLVSMLMLVLVVVWVLCGGAGVDADAESVGAAGVKIVVVGGVGAGAGAATVLSVSVQAPEPLRRHGRSGANASIVGAAGFPGGPAGAGAAGAGTGVVPVFFPQFCYNTSTTPHSHPHTPNTTMSENRAKDYKNRVRHAPTPPAAPHIPPDPVTKQQSFAMCKRMRKGAHVTQPSSFLVVVG